MKKNAPYILMISGVILFILSLWSAHFILSEINYYNAAASVLIVLLGFVELNKKKKNEN
ncbi:hypothetical protein SAMN05443292_2521 [Halpernia frigidisoli]|uniref:Uncharacterized protein n=1 Tax=Halpernia frigidisoli TaxID=1125876 RepID=A0A1I3I1U8_9FLAO|nr:hypothetical protein SAMN05443292_2521 [Halpernia frigidisoli]